MFALQAEVIMEKNKFLTEAHCHALANLKKRDILVFQDKKKDPLGCKVDVLHYEPGFRPQKKIGRRTAVQLMKSSPAPIPIHLNERVTHFSALVPIECEATGRQMRDATKNAKGVVIL